MNGEAGRRARMAEAESAVRELYAALEELAQGQERACGPGCATCCTDRVLLTGVEARLLAAHLAKQAGEGGRELLGLVLKSPVAAGGRPASTVNGLARRCVLGQEPPAEDEPPGPPGVCPLLAEGLCRAYQARPLACRVMISRRQCQTGGWADQDSWWLTLGTAFFQLVEQASAGEPFGLLPEVLAAEDGAAGPGLLVCENLAGIPAPPEHQARLGGILEKLFQRPCAGEPLGLRLNRLRLEQPGFA